MGPIEGRISVERGAQVVVLGGVGTGRGSTRFSQVGVVTVVGDEGFARRVAPDRKGHLISTMWWAERGPLVRLNVMSGLRDEPLTCGSGMSLLCQFVKRR